ncbi:MAG: DUF2834 domain-containing protein [Pseudomonadaceae bacterium]|nr:DUF2834 domain-containing protein [Pseudomonadaceae bacterium]
MKQTYLVLAILGAVVPILFFLGFFHAEMTGLAGFVPALFANSAAAGFTADLLITSVVFWLYMFTAKAGPKPWLFVVLNLCIGLSCALPAYLYARARVAEA